MKNKKVEYIRGDKGLVWHAPAIYDLIKKEAKPGGLLPKSIDTIEVEIINGLCILVLTNGKVIGYAAIIPYSKMQLAKISSYVVAFEERRQGIGTKLAKKIYVLTKTIYPKYRAIAVVSLAAAIKLERLGMFRMPKEEAPDGFIETTSLSFNVPSPGKVILID